MFFIDALVGEEGLVDDCDGVVGGGTHCGLLVHCACGGVEVCGVVYWGHEQFVLGLGYCEYCFLTGLGGCRCGDGDGMIC